MAAAVGILDVPILGVVGHVGAVVRLSGGTVLATGYRAVAGLVDILVPILEVLGIDDPTAPELGVHGLAHLGTNLEPGNQ